MDYLQYILQKVKSITIGNSVLNLVINGLPSIHTNGIFSIALTISFKPCYKWITFNTPKCFPKTKGLAAKLSFKPCYKWITFNTMWYWISLIDVLYKF